MALTRRFVLAACASVGVLRPAFAASGSATAGPSRALLRRAMAALDAHSAQIAKRDLIAIADFSQPSRLPRFHLVETGSGRISSHLVAHGRGSDPAHSGWLKRFSNAPGSLASSRGAYRTSDYYWGSNGSSMRLAGLEADNSNADMRAIVVHGAWYAEPSLIATQGKLGRSEGCFVFGEELLPMILYKLGPGRLIFAWK